MLTKQEQQLIDKIRQQSRSEWMADYNAQRKKMGSGRGSQHMNKVKNRAITSDNERNKRQE